MTSPSPAPGIAYLDGPRLRFTVERLDRLLASGRVSRGRAFLGSVLDVKSVLATHLGAGAWGLAWMADD